jgi:flagellar motor switch protein FliG
MISGQNKDGSISGMDKASVLLLSMDTLTAKGVLKLMEEREIQRLTTHASRMQSLSMDRINEVRKEFLQRIYESSDLLIGQARDQLKGVLKDILPQERYDKFVEYLESNDEISEGFESMKWVDSATIAAFLRDEHPQTIALILAHMEVQKASEILLAIPKQAQADVVMRIAKLDRINPELVREIQEVILTEIMASGVNRSRQVGGAGAVAEILNNIDSQTEDSIFSSVEETDPEMADSIRELMFVFEDLIKLDDRGFQLIMKEVTNDMLTLALKTAPEQLREKMFKNISSRAAEMIREELANMAPTKLSDVEKAQQEIIKICRRLESEGKVQIGSKGGGEVFV